MNIMQIVDMISTLKKAVLISSVDMATSIIHCGFYDLMQLISPDYLVATISQKKEARPWLDLGSLKFIFPVLWNNLILPSRFVFLGKTNQSIYHKFLLHCP